MSSAAIRSARAAGGVRMCARRVESTSRTESDSARQGATTRQL